MPDVEGRRLTGFWLRHQPAGGLPLARRDPPPDNRWQRGEVVDALYLADSEATVWAEWYRHLGRRARRPAGAAAAARGAAASAADRDGHLTRQAVCSEASMLRVTVSIVLPSSSDGLNSTTSVPA